MNTLQLEPTSDMIYSFTGVSLGLTHGKEVIILGLVVSRVPRMGFAFMAHLYYNEAVLVLHSSFIY